MVSMQLAAPPASANTRIAPDAQSLPEFVRASDIRRMFGITDPTIIQWVSRGILPQPIRMVERGIRLWPRDEVLKLLVSRKGRALGKGDR